ncbi:MAG: hypothetical protein E6J34_17895 [Chloroflexi bacterium]|nr:MAG: hypothetical protein E6J34_17895 [Chloroflexota bacterium]
MARSSRVDEVRGGSLWLRSHGNEWRGLTTASYRGSGSSMAVQRTRCDPMCMTVYRVQSMALTVIDATRWRRMSSHW